MINAAKQPTCKHYELRQRLGEGGFGQVFEAWDKLLCRSVALKQLKSHCSADLLKEAQFAAALKHPAFVKVFTIEREAHNHAVVMELVTGKNLHQLMQETQPTQAQALDMVCQVASAMAEAHEVGLIHGDLKPSNLMLDDKGRVRILDFGLAKIQDPDLTRATTNLDPQGTVRYMAPELLSGNSTSAQTDIYALGVIVYELVTATPIFPQLHGIALASTILQSSSRSWDFPATLSPNLCRLIIAMTERDPHQRIASMAQLVDALLQLQQGGAFTASKALPRPSRFKWLTPTLLAARKHWYMGLVLSVIIGLWYSYPYIEHYAVSLKPFSESLSMQRGLAALKQFDRPGSLDLAENEFMQILAHNPKNAAAVAGLSLVYGYQYKNESSDRIWLDKANASAQQALVLDANLYLSQLASGVVHTLNGAGDRAAPFFKKALQLNPDNSLTLAQHIVSLLKFKQWDAAQTQIERGLKLFPTERAFVDLQGEQHALLGQYAKAEEQFRQSIRLQPDAVYSYASLGAILAMQQKYDQALSVLQDGLKFRPNALLYGNIGTILFFKKEYVASVAAFEQAVAPSSGNPNSYLAWANLADGLLWLPNRRSDATFAYKKALQLLERQVTYSPEDETLLSRKALYTARIASKDASQSVIQHLLQRHPTDPAVWFRVALAYELLNEREQALKALTKSVQFGYPLALIENEPDLIDLRLDPRFSPTPDSTIVNKD